MDEMNVAVRIASHPDARDHRGSRVRCLLLTNGTKSEVAARLTDLTAGWAVVDPDRHHWLPRASKTRLKLEFVENSGSSQITGKISKAGTYCISTSS
jgi:hypothetical protein